MFILIERYLDSSRNEYFDTKVYETRKEAVADAQKRFDAFVADETEGWTKQEILESWRMEPSTSSVIFVQAIPRRFGLKSTASRLPSRKDRRSTYEY